MAYLVYGVHQGEGFMVITGEIGAGKTMLVRTLARQLESQNVVMAQVVSTQLEADDLVRMVAASFGLPTESSKASLLTRLEQFLLSTHRQGKRALLMVDEAQNLPRGVGRGTAHAVEFQRRREAAAAELHAGPAGVPQDPAEPPAWSSCASA